MNYLIYVGCGVAGVSAMLLLLNIINILQAGSKRADGRDMRQILGVDPEKAVFEDMERLSRSEKMQLFYAADPIAISELEGEYEARLLSGGVLGPSSALFTHHVFPTGGVTIGTQWVGKGFTKNGENSGQGYNIFTRKEKGGRQSFLRIRKMKTSTGPTLIGKGNKISFHLDYSPFNGGTVRSMLELYTVWN